MMGRPQANGPAASDEVWPGRHSQAVWSYFSASGRCRYTFTHVYRAPSPYDSKGTLCALDEDACHWSATWQLPDTSGVEQRHTRTMTLARARELFGSEVAFTQFSSMVGMRQYLPRMLRVEDHGGLPETPPYAVMQPWDPPLETHRPPSTHGFMTPPVPAP